MRLRNKTKTQDIVVMYTERHLTLRQIAAVVGMTHVSVAKRLRSASISSEDGEWVNTHCAYCGTEIRLTRARWRKSSRLFCGEQCYYKSRENPNYVEWRQGQYIARQIVSRYFLLQPQHVIHHKDTDTSNNKLDNLQVFACQADHMRHHHGITDVQPIWDGSQL